MAKAELGLKRTCVACGTKFYDLAHSPALCPKCGTEQPAEQPRAKRAAPLPEEKVKKRVVPGPAAEGEEPEAEDAEADAPADDAEDLDDAEEDIAEEIGVESEGDEET